jgi:thiol-disulfide isomerase/thioredoxin
MVLPFIEDDYAAAHTQALHRNQLLVIDAWALWCHTCLSMRNYVFTDPLLSDVKDRFVYLSVDTEKPASEAFVQRFPIKSWPTLLVLDPQAGDQLVARWTGAMTAPELRSRLREVLAQRATAQPLLTQADAAALAGRSSEAAKLYARAAQEPRFAPRALLGQIQSLREAGDKAACADLGESAFAQVGASALGTDFAAYAADCLQSDTDAERRQLRRRHLRARLEELLKDPRAELLVDDRSDAYGTLIELADALGDRAGGDAYARARLQLLEAAARAATSPAQAATFDAHRAEAYRRLKRYAEAEAMLLASRKALPGDYDPPARLARLYFEMGKLEAALSQIDQAIALCSGPRRIGMYELRASILHGLGRTATAIQSLRSAIELAQAGAAPGTRSPKVASLEKLLAALQSTQTPAPTAEPSDAVAAQLAAERAAQKQKPLPPSRNVARRDTAR